MSWKVLELQNCSAIALTSLRCRVRGSCFVFQDIWGSTKIIRLKITFYRVYRLFSFLNKNYKKPVSKFLISWDLGMMYEYFHCRSRWGREAIHQGGKEYFDLGKLIQGVLQLSLTRNLESSVLCKKQIHVKAMCGFSVLIADGVHAPQGLSSFISRGYLFMAIRAFSSCTISHLPRHLLYRSSTGKKILR